MRAELNIRSLSATDERVSEYYPSYSVGISAREIRFNEHLEKKGQTTSTAGGSGNRKRSAFCHGGRVITIITSVNFVAKSPLLIQESSTTR